METQLMYLTPTAQFTVKKDGGTVFTFTQRLYLPTGESAYLYRNASTGFWTTNGAKEVFVVNQ